MIPMEKGVLLRQESDALDLVSAPEANCKHRKPTAKRIDCMQLANLPMVGMNFPIFSVTIRFGVARLSCDQSRLDSPRHDR
jgi:hypothetical protein